MKKFIKKLGLFFFTVVFIFSISILITYIKNLNTNQSIKIKGICVIGDSTFRNAVNSEIALGYDNMSQGGESYLFAYPKLVNLAENNKIDTIVLAFAPHNFLNSWIQDDKGTLSHRLVSWFFDYPLDVHEKLITKMPRKYLGNFLLVGKDFYAVNSNQRMKFGSYLPNTGKYNPEDKDTEITKDFIKFNPIEVEYFSKIIQYCKSKNIDVVLMSTPKEKVISEFDETKVKEAFKKLYQTNYYDLDYIDFQPSYSISDDELADFLHLNENGALRFSKYLNQFTLKELIESSYNIKTQIP